VQEASEKAKSRLVIVFQDAVDMTTDEATLYAPVKQ
jgi:hypothetical protein